MKRSFVRSLVIPVALAVMFSAVFLPAGPLHAELQKLSNEDLSQVSGGEGLKMVLRDFQISGNQTIRVKPDPFSDDFLMLGNISLDDGFGNGVTTGCRTACGTPSGDDPISFDIEGSNGGRWVIELPDETANMDANDITIGDVWFKDSSFSSSRTHIFDEVSITDAQYAGGTRFALGTEPGGGMQIGLGLKLDGNVDLSDPAGSGGISITQLGGAQNCTGGPTNFDIDDCTGVLNWATLDGGASSARPLVVEMGDNDTLSITFNPDRNSPTAGQLVIEDIAFGGTSYGEVWTEGIDIRHLQVQGPIFVSNAGNQHNGNVGYEGIEGCECTR